MKRNLGRKPLIILFPLVILSLVCYLISYRMEGGKQDLMVKESEYKHKPSLHRSRNEKSPNKSISYDEVPSISQGEVPSISHGEAPRSIYPIVPRKNYIPNYYTKLSPKERRNLKTKNTKIAFLHYHKSGGSNMRRCLVDLAAKMSIQEHYLIMTETFYKKHANDVYDPNANIYYYGECAFGVCDMEKNKGLCSYFTILREPYDRIVSTYHYCIYVNPTDYICRLWDVKNTPIQKFAIENGSQLFRQILFNKELCSISKVGTIDFTGKFAPCFHKHKMYMDYYLNKTSKLELLSYVTANLENWFTVLGVTHEYNLAYDMLEEAYGPPFGQVCHHQHMKPNTTTRQKQRELLVADKRVGDALYYDLAIYEAVLEIYNRQKNIFLAEKENAHKG